MISFIQWKIKRREKMNKVEFGKDGVLRVVLDVTPRTGRKEISCVVCGEFLGEDLYLNNFPNSEIHCNEVVAREDENRALDHAKTHGGCDTALLRGTLEKDDKGDITILLKSVK
jgi:hypothetical protein